MRAIWISRLAGGGVSGLTATGGLPITLVLLPGNTTVQGQYDADGVGGLDTVAFEVVKIDPDDRDSRNSFNMSRLINRSPARRARRLTKSVSINAGAHCSSL